MMASESRRADLLTLLAIAAGHAPPCPATKMLGEYAEPPRPDEWAVHLMVHAKALGRAVDAELAGDTSYADGGEAIDHYREGLHLIMRGDARPRHIAASYLGEDLPRSAIESEEQNLTSAELDAAIGCIDSIAAKTNAETSAMAKLRAMRPT